jgi:ring-1,2-phenylacetyl-CoA epoxidase subunit PaaD
VSTSPTPSTVPTPAQVWRVLAAVTDPEIPVISISDLGVLRDVAVHDGRITVTITPTYSGCPAMQEIEADVRAALGRQGWGDVELRTVLSPAWTTDWMSEDGRRTLRDFGIAPPASAAPGPVLLQLGRRPGTASPAPAPVACPQCGSDDTEELTRFGSTSCKAMWRCRSCREPFDHFRAH